MKFRATHLVLGLCIATIHANSFALQTFSPRTTLPLPSRSSPPQPNVFNVDDGRYPRHLSKREISVSSPQSPKIQRRGPPSSTGSQSDPFPHVPNPTKKKFRWRRKFGGDKSERSSSSSSDSAESSRHAQDRQGLARNSHAGSTSSYFTAGEGSSSSVRSSGSPSGSSDSGDEEQHSPRKSLKNIWKKIRQGKQPTPIGEDHKVFNYIRPEGLVIPGILKKKDDPLAQSTDKAKKLPMHSEDELRRHNQEMRDKWEREQEKKRQEEVLNERRRVLTSAHNDLTMGEWEKAKRDYFDNEKVSRSRARIKANFQKSAEALRERTAKKLAAIKESSFRSSASKKGEEGSRKSYTSSFASALENPSFNKKEQSEKNAQQGSSKLHTSPSTRSHGTPYEAMTGPFKKDQKSEIPHSVSPSSASPHSHAIVHSSRQRFSEYEARSQGDWQKVKSEPTDRRFTRRPTSRFQPQVATSAYALSRAFRDSKARSLGRKSEPTPSEHIFFKSELKGSKLDFATRHIYPTRQSTLKKPAYDDKDLLYSTKPHTDIPQDFKPEEWLRRDLPRTNSREEAAWQKEWHKSGLPKATDFLVQKGRSLRDESYQFKHDKKNDIRETRSIGPKITFKFPNEQGSRDSSHPFSPDLSASSKFRAVDTQGSNPAPPSVQQNGGSQRRVRFTKDKAQLIPPAGYQESSMGSDADFVNYAKLQGSPQGGTTEDERWRGKGSPFQHAETMDHEESPNDSGSGHGSGASSPAGSPTHHGESTGN